MITLLASPIARKIGGGIAIVLAIGWGYRIVTNRAYSQGQAKGREAAMVEAEAAAKKTWEAEYRKLDDLRLDNAEASSDVLRDRQALEVMRSTLQREQARALATIAARNVEDHQRVETMPVGSIVPGIRSVLDELRTIERQRAAGPAPQ